MRGLRYLSWLLSLLFIAVIVVFAVSNRQTIAIDVWPLPDSMNPTFRLFVIVLIPAAMAYLLGWFVGWVYAGRHRAKARRQAERIDRLTAEIRRLRTRQAAADEAATRDAETARSDAALHAAQIAARREQPTTPSAATAAAIVAPASAEATIDAR